MRLISRFTALALCFALLLCAVPFATNAATSSDFSYELNSDGTITITEYLGNDTDVVVPDMIGDTVVTVIGMRAFENNMTIQSVTLPDELKTISMRAFYNCQNLATVDIGTACYDIGTKAFHNTALLDNAEKGPVYIGRVLYSYAGSMSAGEKITVKYGTAAIAPYAFDSRALLEEIYLPVGLKTIGACAFLDCTALKTVRIPLSVQSIGNSAFVNCDFVNLLGVNNSPAFAYAEENKLDFTHDATLDYPDGDVNMDKSVNTIDCRIMLRILAKAQPTYNEERYQSADVSDDGKVSTADVRIYLRRFVGLD